MARIFAFWTSHNPLPPARIRCLDTLRANSGCDVCLVTPSNLSDWILEPLHHAYGYLSATHRADYLRCYFMHHYGGGYSDIKYCGFDWRPYFTRLSYSKSALMLGYPEKSCKDIASSDPLIQNAFRSLPGVCQFIFKPSTVLTKLWLDALHSALDDNLEALMRNPGNYHPRAVRFYGIHGGGLSGVLRYSYKRYPLSWNQILGSIFHPLMYRYRSSRLILLTLPYVDTSAYR